MPTDAGLPVIHNSAAKRFEIDLDGRIAFSKYLLVGEKIIIEHTEVPIELEGKGIAADSCARRWTMRAHRNSRSCRYARSPRASSIGTLSIRTRYWKDIGTERRTYQAVVAR